MHAPYKFTVAPPFATQRPMIRPDVNMIESEGLRPVFTGEVKHRNRRDAESQWPKIVPQLVYSDGSLRSAKMLCIVEAGKQSEVYPKSTHRHYGFVRVDVTERPIKPRPEYPLDASHDLVMDSKYMAFGTSFNTHFVRPAHGDKPAAYETFKIGRPPPVLLDAICKSTKELNEVDRETRAALFAANERKRASPPLNGPHLKKSASEGQLPTFTSGRPDAIWQRYLFSHDKQEGGVWGCWVEDVSRRRYLAGGDLAPPIIKFYKHWFDTDMQQQLSDRREELNAVPNLFERPDLLTHKQSDDSMEVEGSIYQQPVDDKAIEGNSEFVRLDFNPTQLSTINSRKTFTRAKYGDTGGKGTYSEKAESFLMDPARVFNGDRADLVAWVTMLVQAHKNGEMLPVNHSGAVDSTGESTALRCTAFTAYANAGEIPADADDLACDEGSDVVREQAEKKKHLDDIREWTSYHSCLLYAAFAMGEMSKDPELIELGLTTELASEVMYAIFVMSNWRFTREAGDKTFIATYGSKITWFKEVLGHEGGTEHEDRIAMLTEYYVREAFHTILEPMITGVGVQHTPAEWSELLGKDGGGKYGIGNKSTDGMYLLYFYLWMIKGAPVVEYTHELTEKSVLIPEYQAYDSVQEYFDFERVFEAEVKKSRSFMPFKMHIRELKDTSKINRSALPSKFDKIKYLFPDSESTQLDRERAADAFKVYMPAQHIYGTNAEGTEVKIKSANDCNQKQRRPNIIVAAYPQFGARVVMAASRAGFLPEGCDIERLKEQAAFILLLPQPARNEPPRLRSKDFGVTITVDPKHANLIALGEDAWKKASVKEAREAKEQRRLEALHEAKEAEAIKAAEAATTQLLPATAKNTVPEKQPEAVMSVDADLPVAEGKPAAPPSSSKAKGRAKKKGLLDSSKDEDDAPAAAPRKEMALFDPAVATAKQRAEEEAASAEPSKLAQLRTKLAEERFQDEQEAEEVKDSSPIETEAGSSNDAVEKYLSSNPDRMVEEAIKIGNRIKNFKLGSRAREDEGYVEDTDNPRKGDED